MTQNGAYDAAIVGGGLAGLSIAIQLSRKGHHVIVLEKEQYPLHRVCGEYISMESWDHLAALGIDPLKFKLPRIRHLDLSSVSGKCLRLPLKPGGFAITRYLLDHTLATIARNEGVIIEENTKVNELHFSSNSFELSSSQKVWRSKIVFGCFGKRSNLDIRWKRKFASNTANKLDNYVGVKYHIQGDFPEDRIGLHIFPGGYCGIVKTESGFYNCCYLTNAANLKSSGNSILRMEQTILSRNPYLRKLMNDSNWGKQEPLTISQISFNKKTQVENHALMCGDASGMITPLCGNGMSMALHEGKIAATAGHLFLENKISRDEMETRYQVEWQQYFSARMRTGRFMQRLFGYPVLTNIVLATGNRIPPFAGWLVRQTHGEPF